MTFNATSHRTKIEICYKISIFCTLTRSCWDIFTVSVKCTLKILQTAAQMSRETEPVEDGANKINAPRNKDQCNVKTPSSLLKILLDGTEVSYKNWEKGGGHLTRWL